MRKLLIILLSCIINPIYAKELKSFNEIYESISNGNNIRLVINLDACDPKPSVPHIVVYTSPGAVLLRENYLQFSNSPMTTNNPVFPKTPVLENVTYRITNDNNINMTNRVITLPDYKIAIESNRNCPIQTAARVFN